MRVNDMHSEKEIVDQRKQLESNDTDLKISALIKLGELGEKAILAVLDIITILKDDENKEVRTWAAESLGKINGKKSIEGLANALDDDDDDVRIAILNALGSLKEKSKKVLPSLKRLYLKERFSEVKCKIVWCITEIERSNVLPYLLEIIIQEQDFKIRKEIILSIKRLGKEAIQNSSEVFVDLMKNDENFEVRLTILTTLKEIIEEFPEFIEIVVQILKIERNDEVKKQAIAIIRNHPEKAKSTIPALIHLMLNDENGEIRFYITTALADISYFTDEEVDAFIQTLENDEYWLVRVEAAYALGNSLNEKAVQPLLTTIERDTLLEVRQAASYALSTLGIIAESAIMEITNLLVKSDDEIIRWNAADSLKSMGGEAEKCLPILINALEKDKAEHIRSIVAETIGSIGKDDKEIIDALVKAMKQDKSSIVKGSAVWALGMLENPNVIEEIKIELDNPKNKSHKFKYALALFRLEGLEGEGEKALDVLKNNDKLDKKQQELVSSVKQQLQIQVKYVTMVKETQETESSVKLKSSLQSLAKIIDEQDFELQKILSRYQDNSKSVLDSILKRKNQKQRNVSFWSIFILFQLLMLIALILLPEFISSESTVIIMRFVLDGLILLNILSLIIYGIRNRI